MVIFNVNLRGSVLYSESHYRLSWGRAESFLRPLIYEDGDRRWGSIGGFGFFWCLFGFFFNGSIVQIIVEVVRM